MRIVAVMILTVFIAPSVAAQATGVLESAERAAFNAGVAAAVQESDGDGARRRSMARTIGGSALILLGTPMFLGGMGLFGGAGAEICDSSGCVSIDVDAKGLGAGLAIVGGGAMALGVGLVSVWSDVPVNSVDFRVSPGRFEIGKTIGF